MLYMGAVEGIILSVAVRVAGHASALYVCTYLYVFGIYSQLHYQLNLHTRKQLPRLLAWDRYIPGLWEHWRGFQWPVRRNFQAQSCWKWPLLITTVNRISSVQSGIMQSTICLNMVMPLWFSWASNSTALSIPQGLPMFLPQCRKFLECAGNTNLLALAAQQSGLRI